MKLCVAGGLRFLEKILSRNTRINSKTVDVRSTFFRPKNMRKNKTAPFVVFNILKVKVFWPHMRFWVQPEIGLKKETIVAEKSSVILAGELKIYNNRTCVV